MLPFCHAILCQRVPATASVLKAPRGQPSGERFVPESENLSRQQAGIARARGANGKRADRNAARHLDNRQQRVHALQRFRFDRHTKHRQRRMGCDHAGKMRRAAGPGDNHPDTVIGRVAREFRQPVGRAVGRDDPDFMRHTK